MSVLTRLFALTRLTRLVGSSGVRRVYPPDRGPINSFAINGRIL